MHCVNADFYQTAAAQQCLAEGTITVEAVCIAAAQDFGFSYSGTACTPYGVGGGCNSVGSNASEYPDIACFNSNLNANGTNSTDAAAICSRAS